MWTSRFCLLRPVFKRPFVIVPPLLATPLPCLFSSLLGPFVPQKGLCSVEDGAQQRAWSQDWTFLQSSGKENASQIKEVSSEQVFLNNFRWVPDSCHREEGKNSRELFEKIRVKAAVFLAFRDFGWVFDPLRKVREGNPFLKSALKKSVRLRLQPLHGYLQGFPPQLLMIHLSSCS